MKPKIVIMSYKKLTSLLNELRDEIEKVNNGVTEIKIVDTAWEKTKELANNFINKGEVDVFLSAGSNASIIEDNFNIPLVSIKVTGYDILHALKEARVHSSRIIIANFQNRYIPLDEVKDILKIRFRQVVFNNKEELKIQLEKYFSKGYRVAIGSSVVCEIAETLGMKGIFIYSRDGILRAIETAISLAKSLRQEIENNKQLKAIVDFNYSGIIKIDKRGIIELFNPKAKEIMGFSQEQVKGKVISDIIPSLKVADVLQSGSVKLNQLQLIKDKQIIANIIPINVGGEITGAVITFEDVTTIQKTEQQIRRKLYSKGMVAKFNFKDIIGKSKAIQDTIEVAKNFGQTDSTVLITGETGTGKELFAQSIHNISKRKENPFVAINCAAFPETLLESELFGYEEGAFTGAKKGGKPGLFEMAHTGTIFLDEIGEISPTLQARLLRVLQEKEVMRIGGDKIIPINVRIIAATNKDLKKAVKEGAFREDLFYRLNVLQLKIPPLRDRKEDIPLLIKHFLMIKEPGLIPKLESFIPEICSLTKDYTWPGNVREVENLVERIIALNKQLDISKNHNWLLKAIIDEQIGLCPQDNLKSLPAKKPNQTLDIEVEQAERAAILKTLEQCKGNKTKAAKQLGISRSTLWRKLREI